MKRKFDNKVTDVKKAEETRRTELAMLGLLIEKHPWEAREKVLKLAPDKRSDGAENW